MRQFFYDEEGATAIEYGLIASLVILVLISGLSLLNLAMISMYSSIETAVTSTVPG